MRIDNDNKKVAVDNDSNSIVNITNSTVKIETSLFTENIPLVHKAILEFMSDDNKKTSTEIYTTYKSNATFLNVAQPIKVDFYVSGLPLSTYIHSKTLYISEKADLRDVLSYNVKENNVEIYNLKTNTKYYYSLELKLTDGTKVNTSGSFTTSKSPRILYVDGAINVRDIGGWMTESGKEIPQGLLFRGSELDGAVEKDYYITNDGKNTLLSTLGVKFDMDLRAQTDKSFDALGNIEHRYYNSPMYSDVFDVKYQNNVRAIFSDLSNKDNYPIYLHCTYGHDRTGTICALLEALLGVSKEDCKKDYELTAFTFSKANTEEFNTFLKFLELNYEGDTLSEKAECYLLSIGVTAEEISNIRSIFLNE